MTEHTPLPWICDSEGILPISRDGISVVARIPNHPDNKANWDADAAYIVKACNAFPDLVKALEEIAAIENKEFGPDWEEIEEARKIANDVLGRVKGAPNHG
jgi:hypothetical protein